MHMSHSLRQRGHDGIDVDQGTARIKIGAAGTGKVPQNQASSGCMIGAAPALMAANRPEFCGRMRVM